MFWLDFHWQVSRLASRWCILCKLCDSRHQLARLRFRVYHFRTQRDWRVNLVCLNLPILLGQLDDWKDIINVGLSGFLLILDNNFIRVIDILDLLSSSHFHWEDKLRLNFESLNLRRSNLRSWKIERLLESWLWRLCLFMLGQDTELVERIIHVHIPRSVRDRALVNRMVSHRRLVLLQPIRWILHKDIVFDISTTLELLHITLNGRLYIKELPSIQWSAILCP